VNLPPRSRRGVLVDDAPFGPTEAGALACMVASLFLALIPPRAAPP
jgi:hypothetical protein